MLPDAAYNNNATATTGTVSFTSPDLTWTGNLTPGQAAIITYTVTVANPDIGDKHLVNAVTSDDPGSTCPTGTTSSACTTTVVDLVPALTITKTANAGTVTPGSTFGYTITVADTGQTPYTAARVTDSLAGVLPDAAYDNDATATAGTVSYASPVLTWTGSLNPGDSATIRYSVTVNNPDAGGRLLSNTAISAAPGSTCPSGSTRPGCTATVAVISGTLSISAPGSASLGSAAPGGTIDAPLGTVAVTDDRGFGAAGPPLPPPATSPPAAARPPRPSRRQRHLRHHQPGHHHRPSHLHQRHHGDPVRKPASRCQRHQRNRQHHRHLEPHDRRAAARRRDRRPLHRDDHPFRVLRLWSRLQV